MAFFGLYNALLGFRGSVAGRGDSNSRSSMSVHVLPHADTPAHCQYPFSAVVALALFPPW